MEEFAQTGVMMMAMEVHRGTVLVTGAGGKVAGRVVDQLVGRGWTVVGFDRAGIAVHARAHEWITGDIADPGSVQAAVPGITAIVHAATLTGEHDYASGDLPFRVNVRGTYELFEAARLQRVDKVVHLSEAPVHLVEADTDPAGAWRSASDDDHLYDLTKRLQEEIARDFVETYRLNVLALRLGHVVDGHVGRDLAGRRLEDVNYCRGGWVCCHDVARAVAAGLEIGQCGFAALPVVGASQGRRRFNVAETEAVLGVQFREIFDGYPIVPTGR